MLSRDAVREVSRNAKDRYGRGAPATVVRVTFQRREGACVVLKDATYFRKSKRLFPSKLELAQRCQMRTKPPTRADEARPVLLRQRDVGSQFQSKWEQMGLFATSCIPGDVQTYSPPKWRRYRQD